MVKHIFIDGSAGTTGLQIRERLSDRRDLSLITLSEAEKKDPDRRAEAINDADVSILCLPDAAARESVSLAKSSSVRIIDTSTAHRVKPDWVYGLPEYAPGQAEKIASASRVANPGCYPTGVILGLHPLRDAGLLPADYPVTVSAISGYTGGGKVMIEQYENPASETYAPSPFQLYGLQLQHKHLAEMQAFVNLKEPPIFIPSVAAFPQGMITQVPLYLSKLPGAPRADKIHAILADWYRDAAHVEVVDYAEARQVTRLHGDMLAGSDDVKIYVFESEDKGQALIAAVFDNLGKGASGAAVQNLNLMLGMG